MNTELLASTSSSPHRPCDAGEHYHFFSLRISSDIPLLELTPAKEQGADIELTVRRENFSNQLKLDWFHDWKNDEDDETAFSIARCPGGYLFRVPQVADFEISQNCRTIKCYLHQHVSLEVFRHILLDHVLPRIVGQFGNLVLHASAVQLSSGKGVIFLGGSGAGKSTLASSFAATGATLISDDCVQLLEKSDRLYAVPSYAGFRLWPDSAEYLFATRERIFEKVGQTDKLRLIEHDKASHSQASEISAIIVLGDSSQSTLDCVMMERMEGAEALMLMVRKSFLLDMKDMRAVAKQFAIVSRIGTINPPIYKLSYPRDYAMLSAVRQTIAEHICLED